MSAKPILEIRALIKDRDTEDNLRTKIENNYLKLTKNEYHIIVLFTDYEFMHYEDRAKYPLLTVL